MESKLFVGGIKREVDENTLENYFGKYGDVQDAVVIYSRETGISRGFGFVTFKDSSAFHSALQDAHTDTILGQKVDVRPAKSKTKPENGYTSPESMTKIFVGGLPHNLLEEDFKDFFARFGVIVDSAVVRDKETNRPRGFGFVTFDSKDAVDGVLKNRFYMLNGNNVEVKRAEPKEAKSYLNQNQNGGTGGCGLINSNRFDCSFSHYAPCHAVPVQCVHGHSLVMPCNAIHPNGYDFPWGNDYGCAYNVYGYNGWCSSGCIGYASYENGHSYPVKRLDPSQVDKVRYVSNGNGHSYPVKRLDPGQVDKVRKHIKRCGSSEGEEDEIEEDEEDEEEEEEEEDNEEVVLVISQEQR